MHIDTNIIYAIGKCKCKNRKNSSDELKRTDGAGRQDQQRGKNML